jgi:hypothetical protein
MHKGPLVGRGQAKNTTPVCAEDGTPANQNAHSLLPEDHGRFRLTGGDH